MNVLRKCKLHVCLITMGAALVAVSSCKKESDNPVTTPAVSKNTQLLTSSNWIVQSITVNPPFDFGFGPVSDLYGPSPLCFKDDFFTYKTNGDKVRDQGPSKCNASDPQTTTTKWKFIDNETKLIDGDTATIVTLTSSKLVITTQSVSQGTTYTYTTTYRH